MYTMKNNPKDSEHFQYSSWAITKIVSFFFLLISISYLFYTLGFLTHSYDCPQKPNYPSPIIITTTHLSDNTAPSPLPISEQKNTPKVPKAPPPFGQQQKTNLSHIVFGIAASAKLWNHRKEYIKLWWRPNETRGNVWLDQEVKTDPVDDDGYLLPTLKISSDTSRFKYKHPHGNRSGIRISRIVSETVRLIGGLEKENKDDVRWFVMGDDDTFFVVENLVKVLQKYDHNQFYYIGTSSESHFQNIYFSYNMAYGGGGFAISYPLALALERMQDRCIQRYPALYGSDDRIQACMAELGVPLTKEIGFHQVSISVTALWKLINYKRRKIKREREIKLVFFGNIKSLIKKVFNYLT